MCVCTYIIVISLHVSYFYIVAAVLYCWVFSDGIMANICTQWIRWATDVCMCTIVPLVLLHFPWGKNSRPSVNNEFFYRNTNYCIMYVWPGLVFVSGNNAVWGFTEFPHFYAGLALSYVTLLWHYICQKWKSKLTLILAFITIHMYIDDVLEIIVFAPSNSLDMGWFTKSASTASRQSQGEIMSVRGRHNI